MMGKNTEKYFRIFGMIIFKWYTESFRVRDTREVKTELQVAAGRMKRTGQI